MVKKFIIGLLMLLMVSVSFGAETLNMYRNCDGTIYETEFRVLDREGGVRDLFLVNGDEEYTVLESNNLDQFSLYLKQFAYAPGIGDVQESYCSMKYIGTVTYFKKGIDY